MTEPVDPLKDYCPICGKILTTTFVAGALRQHCCSPRVLAAIDAAHRRGEDHADVLRQRRSERQRRADGVEMQGLSGDDDGEEELEDDP